MIEVVQNEKFERRAIEIISNARRFIYLSTFKMHLQKEWQQEGSKGIFFTLLEKFQKGVQVKIMLQCGYNATSIGVFNRRPTKCFLDAGIQVHYLEGRRVVHAKIILVDGLTLLAGSHNLSVGSLRRNFELSFLIRAIDTVKEVQSFFEQEWDHAKVFKK